MQHLKTILTVIIGILIAVLGEVLAFTVYSNHDQGGFMNGLLGVVAFITILLGAILVVYPLVAYTDKMELYLSKKANYIKFVFRSVAFVFFIAPFVVAALAFYHFTEQYHDTQLRQFGTVTKVLIEHEIRGSNSINHDGNIYDGMLDAWEYQVGDSVEVIYSANNPNEKEWYRKYLKENGR